MQPDAHMCAAAERHPGILVPLGDFRGGKSQRIEARRIGPVFGHLVGDLRADPDLRSSRNAIAFEGEIAHCAARHSRNRRDQAQRFLERHLGQFHSRHIVIGDIAGPTRNRHRLGAQLALPFGVLEQIIQHRAGRAGDRIVRGEHQEDHVIDHLAHVEQAAVFTGGVGELAEHILAPRTFGARLASLERFGGEQLDQEFTPGDPPTHRGARPRLADDPDRGVDQIDERLVDLGRFRTPRDAQKAVRRQIERQLLDCRVEQHRRSIFTLAAPIAHTLGDPAVERIGIMPHRLGLERDRQRPAIDPVRLEIDQHQPAREQLIERRTPALLARKQLVAIEQQQFVGIGPDQRDLVDPERARSDYVSVSRVHPLAVADRVRHQRQRGPEYRNPGLTGNVRERIGGELLAPMGEFRSSFGERCHRYLVITDFRVSNRRV